MLNSKKKFELSPQLKLGVGRTYSSNQILKFSAIICLILALGLAANAVRLIWSNNTNNQANDLSPQVLGVSDSKSSETPGTVQFIQYQVKSGDTLFNISQKLKIDWTTLATLNNLKSPFSLKPGQILNIPKQ